MAQAHSTDWKFSRFVLNMKINWEIKGIAKRFLEFILIH